MRPASAAVRPWYMCKSEPQMARIVRQPLGLIPKSTLLDQTSCSDFYYRIIWMLNLWCRYFFNADLEGLFVVDRFHGGCSCRHFVSCFKDVELVEENSLWYIWTSDSMLPSMLVLLLYPLTIDWHFPHSAGTFPRGKGHRCDVDPQLRQWRNRAYRHTKHSPAG